MKPRFSMWWIVVGLFLAAHALTIYQDTLPEKAEVIQVEMLKSLPPQEYLAEYLVSVMVGGMRPLLVDYLWVQCNELQEEKQYDDMLLALELIGRLQPRMPEVWEYNAWNMSFNLSHGAPRRESAYEWARRGVDHARKGQRYNPRNARLMFYTGFIYYYRFPQSRYLQDRLIEDTGENCFERARLWMLRAKESVPDDPAMAFQMDAYVADCLVEEAMVLVGQGRAAEAKEKLTISSQVILGIREGYRDDVLWAAREQLPLRLRDGAVEIELRARQAADQGQLGEAWRLRWEAMEAYRRVTIDFMRYNIRAVEKRMDRMIWKYIDEVVFESARRGNMDAVAGDMSRLEAWCAGAVPRGHISEDFVWKPLLAALSALGPAIETDVRAVRGEVPVAKAREAYYRFLDDRIWTGEFLEVEARLRQIGGRPPEIP